MLGRMSRSGKPVRRSSIMSLARREVPCTFVGRKPTIFSFGLSRCTRPTISNSFGSTITESGCGSMGMTR